jgi:hypothetical protein
MLVSLFMFAQKYVACRITPTQMISWKDMLEKHALTSSTCLQKPAEEEDISKDRVLQQA